MRRRTTDPDVEAAADDLCSEVLGAIEEGDVSRSMACATVLAALRSQGWVGTPAETVFGTVMDGYRNAELTAAGRHAKSIDSPWAALRDWCSDPGVADVFQRVLRQTAPHKALTTAPGGREFDLDAPDPPPPWIVEDTLIRGRTHLVSGDTGAGKSLVRDAIMAAGLRDETFLGRKVEAKRFMVIDGENPLSDVRTRWKALGIGNEHWPGIHFTDREAGVLLGTPEWDDWLRSEAETFQPDVLFIDTVARCTVVALLDNDSVIALYRDVLTPIVTDFDTALVMFTHERKGRASGDRSEATMGARQWADQADVHLTLAHTGKYEESADGAGSRPFALRRPKVRSVTEDRPEHFEVRGRKAAGTVVELAVGLPLRAVTAEEALIAACDEPLGRKALAEAVNMDPTGRGFRNALQRVMEAGQLVKDEGKDGLYGRP